MTTASATDRKGRLHQSVAPFLSFFNGIPRFAAAMSEARSAFG
jgi:hypothetical protein